MAAALLGAVSPAGALDIEDVFRNALACSLIEPRLADTRAAPLFRDAGEGCAPGFPDRETATEAWYLDAACSLPVPVERTSLPTWCDSLLEPGTLGEGGASGWTLSPGSRLDLGARSLDGVVQPWLHREVFRRIDTAGGTCELQMRVYAPAPVVAGRAADPVVAPDIEPVVAANGLAMIAWHGGSWSNRAFGSFGLELTVPHFVARGFTVYVPFYRLLGDSPDGSAACREADFERDVIGDAEAALDWVRDNGERFGTRGAPILFGQSAGGQLAARLAVDRPDEVAGAVLFYAPVDFEDFAQRAQSGDYVDEQGLGILERVLGVPAAEADLSAEPIASNALPRRIVRDGIQAPPMFLLHGEADGLVEVRQSTRLCDALAGREIDAAQPEAGSFDPLRQVTLCGDGSSLHRLRQGQHALDVCLVSGPVPLDSCPAGSEASRERVADSIGSAAVFAETIALAADRRDDGQPPDNPLQEGESPPGEGGGGAGVPWGLAWLLVGAATLRAAIRLRPGGPAAGSDEPAWHLRAGGRSAPARPPGCRHAAAAGCPAIGSSARPADARAGSRPPGVGVA